MTKSSDLAVLAGRAAVEAIAIEHGPQSYAEQARDGNWPIYRAARAAALLALRAHLTENSNG